MGGAFGLLLIEEGGLGSCHPERERRISHCEMLLASLVTGHLSLCSQEGQGVVDSDACGSAALPCGGKQRLPRDVQCGCAAGPLCCGKAVPFRSRLRLHISICREALPRGSTPVVTISRDCPSLSIKG